MSAAGPPQGARPLGGAARSAVRGEPASAAGPPQGARPLGGAARSAVRGDQTTSVAFRLIRAACACAAALAIPGLAHAQVYKCVDRAGRTTYQQQPCPDTQKGVRMSLSVDNGSTRQDDAAAAALEAQADQKKVVPGMSRSLVAKAYGTPQDMRPGQVGEDASEVWVYRKPELNVRVGFRGGFVVWLNENAAVGIVPGTAADASERQMVAPGMACAPLPSQLGNPTSQEEEYDSALERNVLRMTWPPLEVNPERLVVTCDGGVIARIDRVPVTK